MTPLDKPSRSVTRVTVSTLGFTHGCDSDRTLVCTLAHGDLLVMRPAGTRRSKTVRLADIYAYAIRCEANQAKMEKLRERKAKLAERRAENSRRRELGRVL